MTVSADRWRNIAITLTIPRRLPAFHERIFELASASHSEFATYSDWGNQICASAPMDGRDNAPHCVQLLLIERTENIKLAACFFRLPLSLI